MRQLSVYAILGSIIGVGGILFYRWRQRKAQNLLSENLREYATLLKPIPLIYDVPTRFVQPWKFSVEKNRWVQFHPTEQDGKEIPNDITLVTYNIWFSSHKQKERTDALLQILREKEADIICLQEVTSTSLDLLQQNEFLRDNYISSDMSGHTFQGYGVVIFVAKRLSSYINDLHVYFRNLPSNFCRRCVFVDLHYSLRDEQRILRVASVHLESSSGAHSLRKDQLRIIGTMLKNRDPTQYEIVKADDKHLSTSIPGVDLFLLGDFNFDYDWLIKNQRPCEEYDVLNACGLKDAWKELHHDEPGFSVPDYNGLPARRIDHITYTSDRFQAELIELIGTEDISNNECDLCTLGKRVCSPSDHFGLFSYFKTFD